MRCTRTSPKYILTFAWHVFKSATLLFIKLFNHSAANGGLYQFGLDYVWTHPSHSPRENSTLQHPACLISSRSILQEKCGALYRLIVTAGYTCLSDEPQSAISGLAVQGG